MCIRDSNDAAARERVAGAVFAAGWGLQELRVERAALESVFSQLTRERE